jgi:CRP/FNR family transcriptional regulator
VEQKTGLAILDLLQKFPLLQDMSHSDLNSLAQVTRLDTLEEGAVIFYQGDDCERVYLVMSGRVKIVYHDRDGREVILEMITPGEAFGGAVLLFPRHPATAIAMEATVIASFTTEDYSHRLLNHPAATLKLLKMLGARHLMMINMQTMAGERVERRMAHILLKLAARAGRQTREGVLITIPLSRQDLADMACTTLETAIRTISRFQKAGLISTQRGGYILVLNQPDLEKMS